MRDKIFVSYRRKESTAYARNLSERLRRDFGKDCVFWDIDTIEPGEDFDVAIRRALGSCAAMVVILGQNWIATTGKDGKRKIDEPNDWVRRELLIAFELGLRVIPVLVNAATMPVPGDVPKELSRLPNLEAFDLSDSRWDFDVGRLVESLRRSFPRRGLIGLLRRLFGADADAGGGARWRLARVAAVVGIACLVAGVTLSARIRTGVIEGIQSMVATPAAVPVASSDSRLSIAVLPFRTETQDKNYASMPRGLQNAISTAIMKMPQVRVKLIQDEASSDNVNPIGEARRRHGVRKVITGWFQIWQDKIEIHARLFDAATEEVEQSEEIDGLVDDFINLQNQIAAAIVKKLPVPVSDTDLAKVSAPNASDSQETAAGSYKYLLQSEGLDQPSGGASSGGAPNPKPTRATWLHMLIDELAPTSAYASSGLTSCPSDGNADLTATAVCKTLEDYRVALQSKDWTSIDQIRGTVPERQRAGLQMYFANALDLHIDFEQIEIEPVDPERYSVAYLRRDRFTDRIKDESVTLEIRFEGFAVRQGDRWTLTSAAPK